MAANEGRSHAAMANQMFEEIKRADNRSPLADAGALYRFERRIGLWSRYELDALARFIGNALDEKNCKRVADYRGIAQLVYSRARDGVAHDGSPFDAAPPGIAANGTFYFMNGAGVECAKLAPEHLARFAVPVAPDDKHARPLFDALIAATFPPTDDDHEEQRALLQEHFGACVIGVAARMQKAMLWRGVERSGKSTLQEIMRSMFKPENIAAVPPHLWFHEYHCAALAAKILNPVGEIDDKRPLTVAFKNVIGRDLLHGRHVTHRPFSFRNEAGHVFNSNGFPPTEDQTNAFWDRWSCVEFRHTRAPEKRDDRLAEKIITTELPGVLAWALHGAHVLGHGGGRFMETTAHKAMMERWRGRTDSVRSWLLDPEAIELLRDHPDDTAPKEWWLRSQTELHRHYCAWCQLARRHPLGLHTFGDALRNAFALAGLVEDRETHKVWGAHPRDLNFPR
jgi:putative DNA primase/helicase